MGAWVHRLTEVNGDTVVCAYCGTVPVYMKRLSGGTYQPRCSNAIKRQRNRAEKWPDADGFVPLYRGRGHRLSQREADDYKRGKSCSICGRAERLHIDHDHASGDLRGVLCHFCNLGVGHFFDNSELLRAAADYLDAANGQGGRC